MRIGVDFSGTITVPQIRNIVKDLKAAGHTVFLVTGVLEGENEEGRKRIAKKLGLEYVPLIVKRGMKHRLEIAFQKTNVCNRLGLTIFFENDRLQAEYIAKYAPTTVVLLVAEPMQ